jgi:colanic acid/amylovoran biosynthesis glycosyltransferase
MHIERAIRVLIVVADFPALSETFVLDQITGLIDRGFTVDILAARARDETKVHPDVASYRLKERVYYADWSVADRRGAWQSARMILKQIVEGRLGVAIEMLRVGFGRKLGRPATIEPRQLLAYARTLETLPAPDVVICHFGPNGDLMVRLRQVLRAQWAVATFFHGYDITTLLLHLGPHLYDRLFRDGDFFFPVSDFFMNRLLQLGAAGEKTAVQRMGARSDMGPAIREPSPVSIPTFTFLLIGRLVEKKGQEYAVRAVAQCRRRNPQRDIRLTIIGEGPLDTRLREIISELDLNEIVHLQGSQSRDYIQKALLTVDAFVLPSVTAANGDMEGIPVVISEAMSMSLPVIATRHSGIPEIVEDGVTGFLVAERDVEALADAMARLAADPELAQRLGRAGRDKLVQELDLDQWNDLLAERVTVLAGLKNNQTMN